MIITPNLLIQCLINGILLGGVYGLLAMGLSLFFGVTRVANSAHGSFAILGSFISYWLYTIYRMDPILTMVIPMTILFGIGMLVQKFVISRVIGIAPLTAFTLTYFLSITLENTMVVVWKNEYRTISTPYVGAPIVVGSLSIPIGRLISLILCIVALLALMTFTRFTRVGKAMRAVAQNREAAMLCGISVGLIYMLAFGISLALASTGGTMMAVLFTFYPSLQALWIGRLYAVVIFGGLGSITGSVVAAMIMSISDAFIGLFMPIMWGSVVSWVLLLIILLLRPTGLLGRK